MNLLLFNLATDADDPILSFTTLWINRLAPHYDHIDVITMRAGRLAVAENVTVFSIGKEKGYGETRRALEFYRLLFGRLRQRRYAACFAHMMPLFAVMGAPLLRLYRLPITLWYTHRSRHWTARLGMKVSRRVVTAAPDSFPFQTPKLRVIGHGIDTDFFSPASLPHAPLHGEGEPPPKDIVHVARLMPIKHQATLLRAIGDIPEASAVFVGDVPPEKDASYRAELEQMGRDLGISDRVIFAGDQPPEGVRDCYRRAAAAVNLSPPGLFDKAALEPMAVGIPTIVSNAAFESVLGQDAALLRVASPDNHAALAERLRQLLALTDQQRAAIGSRLRANVVAGHSFDALIPRLVSVLKTGEPVPNGQTDETSR